MNTYDLLRRGQHDILEMFPALAATRASEPVRRRALLADLRNRLRDHGRIARCIYGPLLRHGADPALVLSTFETEEAVLELLARTERQPGVVRCWIGRLGALRRLVREHFDAQEAPLRRGTSAFLGTDPEILAPTRESLRAAARADYCDQSSAAVGSAGASRTSAGSRSAAAANARDATSV